MAPTPTYDKDVNLLLSYYKESLQKVSNELNRVDINNFERANLMVVQKEIADVLGDLDEKTKEWVSAMVPKATEDGIIHSIMSLGVASTVEDAQRIVTLNRLNREFIKTAVADLQDDLLQVSKNVERKVRTTLRQVTAEAMRSNLTQGINTTDAISRDLMSNLRKRLGDSINTGIIDSAGRRWKPEVYAEMVTRTKLAHTQRESAVNDALGRNAFYGVISSHGAKDLCRNWEGKVVKLTMDAPGDYPYYGALPNREIFHPNCKHVISPVRRLDRLPENIRVNNGVPDVQNVPARNGQRNPLYAMTDEKQIVRNGGKVAKGGNALTKLYGGMDDDQIEDALVSMVSAQLRGQYRGAGSALFNLREEWVDDNKNAGAVAMENYISEKYGLAYKIKNRKKLTDREKAAVDIMLDDMANRFKEAGITHVKVYRGVAWDSKNSWLPDDVNNMTLTGRGLSSWTMRKDVAEEYASYVDDFEEMGNMAGVIEAVIPVDQLAFTAIIGDTDEVVAIGDIAGAKLIKSRKAGGKW
jgi:hypothetical protein